MKTESAFDIENIFDKYKDKIYWLAISISRNERDAEDILQNTFISVIKNLKSLRDKSNLATWVYRIAYNEALAYLRKRKSGFKLSNKITRANNNKSHGFSVNESRMPDEALLDSELKERLLQAVINMPLKYRMPFLLSNTVRMPEKDASYILGVNLNSFKTRLRRAHQIVKSDVVDYLKDKQLVTEDGEEAGACNRWSGFIYDFMEGNLDKKKQGDLKKHIAVCRNCRSFIDVYIKAIVITKALQYKRMPPELRNKIKALLLR